MANAASVIDALHPTPSAKKRDPKIVPFDDFCLKFFTQNADHVLRVVSNNDITEAAGGIVGLLTKSYEAYRIAIKAGWERLGE